MIIFLISSFRIERSTINLLLPYNIYMFRFYFPSVYIRLSMFSHLCNIWHCRWRYRFCHRWSGVAVRSWPPGTLPCVNGLLSIRSAVMRGVYHKGEINNTSDASAKLDRLAVMSHQSMDLARIFPSVAERVLGRVRGYYVVMVMRQTAIGDNQRLQP